MMDIENSITAGMIAAHLACMIIALACASSLSTPVWAIVANMAAIVIWIAFTSHPDASSSSSAFDGAIVAATKPDLVSGCFIFLTTGFAYSGYVDFWLYLAWLGLPCCELGAALIGTETWLAISPFFKLFAAPFTCKDRTLRRIGDVLGSALGRTVDLAFFRYLKFFVASWAYLENVFFLRLAKTFSGAILTSLCIVIISWLKGFPTVLASRKRDNGWLCSPSGKVTFLRTILPFDGFYLTRSDLVLFAAPFTCQNWLLRFPKFIKALIGAKALLSSLAPARYLKSLSAPLAGKIEGHLPPLVDVASGFSRVGGSLSRGSGFRAVALAP
jgi:hypothetical protein